MNHKAEDTHHSGTAVVQLNGTLGELGLFIEGVPAEVKSTVTEVTNEFILSGNILHDTKLEGTNEGKDLGESSLGDSIRSEESGQTVGEGVEGVSGGVDASRKVNTGTGSDLSKEGKLTDTAVLELDVTETVETLLVGIIEQSQRIEEAKGSLSTKLVLEGVKCGGGGLVLGRGKSGGRADKGGDDSRLHVGNR